ncbi:hypothetical protein GEMRC1_005379 [Eukaryota sp. GEM-RC1]
MSRSLMPPGDHPERCGFTARKFLQQLTAVNLRDGWLTYLRVPLAKQDPSTLVSIAADTPDLRNAYGNNTVSLTKSCAQHLLDSASIFVCAESIPKTAYLLLLKKFKDDEINIIQQDVRSFGTVCNLSPNGSSQWQSLGFSSFEHYQKSLKTPLLILASAVVHAQLVHFFVEQAVDTKGFALNQIRSCFLDDCKPNLLVSVPGLNFAYSSLSPMLVDTFRHDSTQIFKILSNLWFSVLSAVKHYQYTHLAIPAIGLGVFLSGSSMSGKEQSDLARMYFDSLMTVYELFKTSIPVVYFNPMRFKQELNDSIKQFSNQDHVINFQCDVKLIVVELAKAGVCAALLNPSDADVMWGVYDVGEYWKNGSYAAEEDLACTSTAVLGSAGINDVYCNERKVFEVAGFSQDL